MPTVAPSVQPPTVAIPCASVVWDAPDTVPPPLPTAKITGTPATGFPFLSRTTTDGSGLATELTAAGLTGDVLAATADGVFDIVVTPSGKHATVERTNSAAKARALTRDADMG
jgi:hypothetical protein